MLGRDTELNDILLLMQLQNKYITQLCKVVYSLYTDLNLANNMEFQEFTTHFVSFGQNHFNSEGFGQAIDAIQIYHYGLLEQLLDGHVLGAAEQLELAISHLEVAIREPRTCANPQIVVLNQGLILLEENLLKIIETLEALLENRREKQFPN
ncbi:Hypothetical protein LUCI_2098 [Lucifera butyrica]|uniref:Uncharacterized protein n=1 Tax=Lucifera butyrica TaxID=1351585 RepID=A0A498R635_9FIRM|nr:hypothetical protein [Lucifera butyrica]VBB06861.1 Hypothetical protein LUCI_2098 [Lucifera butyrica]